MEPYGSKSSTSAKIKLNVDWLSTMVGGITSVIIVKKDAIVAKILENAIHVTPPSTNWHLLASAWMSASRMGLTSM